MEEETLKRIYVAMSESAIADLLRLEGVDVGFIENVPKMRIHVGNVEYTMGITAKQRATVSFAGIPDEITMAFLQHMAEAMSVCSQMYVKVRQMNEKLHYLPAEFGWNNDDKYLHIDGQYCIMPEIIATPIAESAAYPQE